MELANLIVLSLTGLVVFWYTIETYKLRQEAQATNAASLTPIPALVFHATKTQSKIIDADIDVSDKDILITNIGLSPALNITFEVISNLHPNEPNPVLFRLVESNILMPNELKVLAVTAPSGDSASGRLRGSHPHPYLIPGMSYDANGNIDYDTPSDNTHWKTHSYTVKMTYENPYGEKFSSHLMIDKSGSHQLDLKKSNKLA